MKLPKTIKINHATYSIRTAPDSSDDVRRASDGKKCLGIIDYEKREIVLNERYPERHAETLLHEVLHGIDYAVGYTLSEAQVHSTALGLFGVLKDNPAALSFIFGETG